jgi:hypothetical protein
MIGKVPMGPWPLYIYICDDAEELCAFMMERGATEDEAAKPLLCDAEAATGGWFDQDDELNIYLFFPYREGREVHYMASIAAHESTHALQLMNEFIGEKEPGHEAEAYFVGYLTQASMEVLLNAEGPKDEKEVN